MAENEKVRIEIGFEGGQVMGVLVTAVAAKGLEDALKAGREPVHELEADDGIYLVALGRLVYVKRFARESRVGFAGAA